MFIVGDQGLLTMMWLNRDPAVHEETLHESIVFINNGVSENTECQYLEIFFPSVSSDKNLSAWGLGRWSWERL